MTRFRYIEIDGKRYLWRDIQQLRRDQKKAHTRARSSRASLSSKTIVGH